MNTYTYSTRRKRKRKLKTESDAENVSAKTNGLENISDVREIA